MGMEGEEAIKILRSMVRDSLLDAGVVNLLEKNFDEINFVRELTQKSANVEYVEFVAQLENEISKG